MAPKRDCGYTRDCGCGQGRMIGPHLHLLEGHLRDLADEVVHAVTRLERDVVPRRDGLAVLHATTQDRMCETGVAPLSVGRCGGREICSHLLESHGEVGRAEFARLVQRDVHARGHQLAHRPDRTDRAAHAQGVTIRRTRNEHHLNYLRARASLGHAMGFRCT